LVEPRSTRGNPGYLQMRMAWFGCALLAFLLFVMELVFRANLHDPPRLNSGALILALAAFCFYGDLDRPVGCAVFQVALIRMPSLYSGQDHEM